mgnify:FL=1
MTYHILTPNILKSFYPLNSLQDEEINLLLQKTQIENIHRGNTIFNQGADDSDVIYLISGSVRLESDSGAQFILESDSEQAIYPLANIKPRNFSAFGHSDSASIARLPTKTIESLIFNLDKDKLWMSGGMAPETENRILDSEWMMAMKKTPLFSKFNEETLSELFHVMEEVAFKSDETVIREGDEGDYFYLIKEGKCRVTSGMGINQTVLAEFGQTDSFGEDALLTKSQRNATVTMIEDGVLMRLSKDDFDHFMFQPLVQWINSSDARQLLKNGATPVDIRSDANRRNTIKNSIFIPLRLLREKLVELDKDKKYLILCDNKKEAAVSSFLFSKYGLDGYILRGDNAPKSK